MGVLASVGETTRLLVFHWCLHLPPHPYVNRHETQINASDHMHTETPHHTHTYSSAQPHIRTHAPIPPATNVPSSTMSRPLASVSNGAAKHTFCDSSGQETQGKKEKSHICHSRFKPAPSGLVAPLCPATAAGCVLGGFTYMDGAGLPVRPPLLLLIVTTKKHTATPRQQTQQGSLHTHTHTHLAICAQLECGLQLPHDVCTAPTHRLVNQ